MARPMSAAGLWNPKAIRVMSLILVFTDSIRPLLSLWSRVAWMLLRMLRIFFASLWVPKISSTLRDQAIFVDRATDASPPSYAILPENDRVGERFHRGSGLERAV